MTVTVCCIMYDSKYDNMKRQKPKYITPLIENQKDPRYHKVHTKSGNQIEDTHQHKMHLNLLYVYCKN